MISIKFGTDSLIVKEEYKLHFTTMADTHTGGADGKDQLRNLKKKNRYYRDKFTLLLLNHRSLR